MRGETILDLSLGVLLVVTVLVPAQGAARAQTSKDGPTRTTSYFPLMAGNKWVYQRTTGGGIETFQMTVGDRVTPREGNAYFLLDGYFGAQRVVRSSPDNSVTEDKPDDVADNQWYLLDSPVGTSWQLDLEPLSPDECIDGSKLVLGSRIEEIQVPAGSFHDVVRVDFMPSCVDAGITSEWFAPGVGLVRRVETSFAGPIVTELARAQVGDLILPLPSASVSLSLDQTIYHNLMPSRGVDVVPTLHGAFTINNPTSQAIVFSFSGCKGISVEVMNEAGEVIMKAHGDDGGCCECEYLVPVTLVESLLIVPVSFPLQAKNGEPLPDGRYAVMATLDSLDRESVRPSATMMIEVQSDF